MDDKTTASLRDDLRQKAEQQLQQATIAVDEKNYADVRTLLHELQVHEIELALQNEELRRTQVELEISRTQYVNLYEKYLDLYNFAPVGYCTVAQDGTIQELNMTAAEQLGAERGKLVHSRLYRAVVEEDRETLFLHLRKTFATHVRQTCDVRLLRPDKTTFYAHLESIVPREPEGAAETMPTSQFCRMTISDITDRIQAEEQLQAALQDKNVLIQEVHHRTKNNMQVISSILTLQAAESKHEEVQQIVRDSQRRIQTMALVHEKLYQSQNLSEINLQDYIRDLTLLLSQSEGTVSQRISFVLDIEPVIVLIDTAIPCGLIVNELISNAQEHAFPKAMRGEILIRLARTATGDIDLCVADNGIGVPNGFDFRKQTTLGIKIILGIAEHQFHGTVKFEAKNGTACNIRFPEPLYKQRIGH